MLDLRQAAETFSYDIKQVFNFSGLFTNTMEIILISIWQATLLDYIKRGYYIHRYNITSNVMMIAPNSYGRYNTRIRVCIFFWQKNSQDASEGCTY